MQPTSTPTTSPTIKDYETFWPFYLGEHSKPWTKRLHVLGVALVAITIVTLAVQGLWAWLPLALIAGYGPAWIAHFFIEGNRPATWKYPAWSFISDFRMTYLYLRGRL